MEVTIKITGDVSEKSKDITELLTLLKGCDCKIIFVLDSTPQQYKPQKPITLAKFEPGGIEALTKAYKIYCTKDN